MNLLKSLALMNEMFIRWKKIARRFALLRHYRYAKQQKPAHKVVHCHFE